MSLASKRSILQERALAFQKVRSFFSKKNVLEVDTPLLSKTAPIDEHIDIMTVQIDPHSLGYLHSSPEYAMKRLLSLDSGDIFQMSHVFRQGEHSPRHNPEFTMVEWYRIQMPFVSFIEETADFIELFLGKMPRTLLSYRKAFFLYTGIDYLYASKEDLIKRLQKENIEISTASSWDKEGLLHLIMGCLIEPHLGKNELLILTDYPASQASLAQIENKEGEMVAKRFEIYHQGIELANGYLELIDAAQQKKRLLEASSQRTLAGKDPLPIDEKFLEALKAGIPPCCGVAVGFDRLLMLQSNSKDIKQVLAFSWDEL